jgi:cytochrome d ubiquinol oxidase subunit II
MRFFTQKGDEMKAFLSSCLFLVAMLVGAAAGLYPTVLPSSTDPSRDLTIREALSGLYALRVGLMWWSFGILLAVLYFVTIYRMFRGKVSGEADYGH